MLYKMRRTIISIVILLLFLIWQVEGLCRFEGRNEESIVCTKTNVNEFIRIKPKKLIENIRIYDSTIEKLPNNFIRHSSTKYLQLHSKTKELNSGAFKIVPNLIGLDLSKNYIKKIPLDLFEDLNNLKYLNMSQNELGNPTLDTFYGLNQLENLDLSHNRMTFLILGSLDEMVSLKYLNLSNNAFVQLHLNTFDQNKQMVELNLSNNLIKSLKLGMLDKLANLTSLNLAGNKIKNIPLGFFDAVSKLLKFDISKNELNDVPLGIFDGLKSAEYVSISHNWLLNKTLHFGVFDGLKNVLVLNMSYCNINILPLGIFDNAQYLNVLDLSHNNIKTMNPYLLDGKKLEILNLSYNKLESFPVRFFNKLLKKLNLRNNFISYFNSTPFRNKIFEIEYMDIRFNDVAFLPKDIFDSFVFLKIFEIGGNPWECACLGELINILNSRFVAYDRDKYFDGNLPSCIFGDTKICENNVTYQNSDKIEFLSYFK